MNITITFALVGVVRVLIKAAKQNAANKCFHVFRTSSTHIKLLANICPPWRTICGVCAPRIVIYCVFILNASRPELRNKMQIAQNEAN